MTKDIHCPECNALIDGDNMSADPQRRRFFAAIRDTHASLNDEQRRRFPSSEHLRKHALIAAGWCDVMTVLAGAKSAAPGIEAALKSKDRYIIIDIRDAVLTMYTARSVSRSALKKREFVDVAQRAFEWIYQTVNIDPAQSQEWKQAA